MDERRRVSAGIVGWSARTSRCLGVGAPRRACEKRSGRLCLVVTTQSPETVLNVAQAVPALRLDHRNDRQRLCETVERIRPRLVVLDPLVRLHGVDENAVAEVAPILGFPRNLWRRFETAPSCATPIPARAAPRGPASKPKSVLRLARRGAHLRDVICRDSRQTAVPGLPIIRHLKELNFGYGCTNPWQMTVSTVRNHFPRVGALLACSIGLSDRWFGAEQTVDCLVAIFLPNTPKKVRLN